MAAPDRLRNLGPKTREWLAAIGVRTHRELARLGAIETYLRLQEAGCKVSLNALWALEGALQDRDWKDIARHERSRLILELDAAQTARRRIRGRAR